VTDAQADASASAAYERGRRQGRRDGFDEAIRVITEMAWEDAERLERVVARLRRAKESL
jgi:hypothetical protein